MLENLKVLDFTTLLPGPYATFLLASMGAKVTKVSAPGKIDLVLESGPRQVRGKLQTESGFIIVRTRSL